MKNRLIYKTSRAVTHGNGIYEKSLVPPDENYVNSHEEISSDLLSNITCYPNPFKENTTILFNLIAPSTVRVNIYNTTGQIIKSYPTRYYLEGHHQLVWDGKTGDGVFCLPGIYYGSISAGNSKMTVTIVRNE